jgi:hypothetical protein
MCPTFLGASDFRPESPPGVVEFSDAKPVCGAKITVMCKDGKVLAQVETGTTGITKSLECSVDYNCLLDPKIPGYLKGEMHCITRAFLDWRLSKGFDPVVTPCSPTSWSRDTCPDRQVRKYRTFDPLTEGVEISGTVVYYTKNPPFKFVPDVTIAVCSASGKLLGRARTDALGYYELHLPKNLPKNDSPYSCVLRAPDGYLAGEARCAALGWTLRRGQIPTAASSGRCDYVYGCPGARSLL